MWRRYIDNIFILWSGPSNLLRECIQELNNNTFILQFTFSYDIQQISFLDLTIYKGPNTLLATNLYRKPTATNAILHASSSHPKHVIQGIPTGQYCRIRRNCTKSKTFEQEVYNLQRFLSRGYSKKIVSKKLIIGLKIAHVISYSFREKKMTSQNKTRLITKFNAQSQILK